MKKNRISPDVRPVADIVAFGRFSLLKSVKGAEFCPKIFKYDIITSLQEFSCHYVM